MTRWALALGLIGLSACHRGAPQPGSPALQSMFQQTITAPPSQISYLDVIADASASDDFIDVTTSTNDLTVSLVLPTGQEVSRTNAGNAGVTVQRLVKSPSDLHTAFILRPGLPAGKYRVKVDATRAVKAAKVTATYVSFSGVKAGIGLNSTLLLRGEPIAINAGVFSATGPITVASASATIIPIGDPEAVSKPVPFASANKGVYRGTYIPPAPGKYRAVLDVQGTQNGAQFRRTASAYFEVTGPTATVVGVRDQAFDDDGNGSLDRLVNYVDLMVQTPGKYRVSLDLVGGLGQVSSLYGEAKLHTGRGEIAIEIPASSVGLIGGEGPYKKKRVALGFVDDRNHRITADIKDDAGATAAYKLASFEHGPPTVNAQYASTPIDKNGIPGFEALDVEVSFPEQPADNCGASADLYAGDIFFDSGSSQNNYRSPYHAFAFRFDGYRIRGKGLDGPYGLRNVTIACGQVQTSGSEAFRTSAFRASDFESGIAEFSLAAPALVTAAATRFTIITVNIRYAAGFDQPIRFEVTGVPSGSAATMAFPVAYSLNSVNVALEIKSTSPGSYPVKITGTSGSLKHAVNVTLVVPPGSP